jgi:tetratricopeptide (TPR) repeat protein
MGIVYLVRSVPTGHAYAVKQARLPNSANYRPFLVELLNWFDLPSHPHLVDCYFFRTIQNEIAIFAEFVDGESVYDAIRSRRLSDLDRILDVAIQSAWGLHAAHESGLIHQDVKPGNLLMTADGVTKVADFGLARARAVSMTADAASTSGLVSCNGMTALYRSPEQMRRQRLDRSTDAWSWGVSLLHMALGEFTWQDGSLAREVLAHSLEGRAPAGHPVIPPCLVDVLDMCFMEDPKKRWATLDDAASALVRIYESQTGHPYPRPQPAISKDDERQAYDRRLMSGIRWSDPAQTVRQLAQASGRPLHLNVQLPAARRARGQAVADLIAFTEAVTLVGPTLRQAPLVLAFGIVRLFLEKAFNHEWLGDIPGALGAYDAGIRHCLHIIASASVPVPAVDQAQSHLATLYINKAKTLADSHDLEGSDALLTQAIQLSEIVTTRHPEERDQLAAAYNNKGEALRRLGKAEASLGSYDKAIHIRRQLLRSEPAATMAGLGQTYLNKAEVLKFLGKLTPALETYDEALRVLGEVTSLHVGPASHLLSAILLGRVEALRILGRMSEATGDADRAIAIRERNAAASANASLRAALAEAYLSKGALLQSQPATIRAAVELYRQGVDVYQRLVKEQGGPELVSELFVAYARLAGALQLSGESGARDLYDRALELWDRMSDPQRLAPQGLDAAANAYFNRALLAERERDAAGALRFYDLALAAWNAQPVSRADEIRGDLARARLFRAHLLYGLTRADDAWEGMRQNLTILEQEAERTADASWRAVVDLAHRERWLQKRRR